MAVIRPKHWAQGMKITPGWYDIPADVYHARQAGWPITLNSSALSRIVNQSPLHAYDMHSQLGAHNRQASTEMDFGTIAHSLILGKGRDIVVLDFPDFRSTAAKVARDEVRANGQTPVLKDKMQQPIALAQAFRDRVMASDARGFYAVNGFSEGDTDDPFGESKIEGHCEVAGVVELDGVMCQILLDKIVVTPDFAIIYDIKTTTSAHPKAVAAKIANMGYDIQQEFYTRCTEALLPHYAGRVQFVFLFIESASPYALLPVKLSGKGCAVAASKMERGLATWSSCLSTGEWPGYGHGICAIDPPPWAISAEMEEGLYI